MKIGIDISQIVYGTGSSKYTENLVSTLLKVDHTNQYVLFGSALRQKKKLDEFKRNLEEYKNVEFKFYSFPPRVFEVIWNALHILPIDKFIGKVDVFHSSDWLQPPIKSSETKKVTTVHDMVVYLFPSSIHPRILSNQKKRLKQVKKEVNLILADSHSTKEDVIKFLQIPEEKIFVVHLAAAYKFKPEQDDRIEEVLQKYKIKKPYILSVATQEPRKNIQKLLDVFETLSQPQKFGKQNLQLVLTGKFGWGEGLRSAENVIWTDYVPDEDLIALYSGCRVFVYPSLYEGFGLPVLEAMACGAPVITSKNSSMAEIARDTAILVDPRSEGQLKKAIEMVLDLKLESYQKMVNASLTRARQFSWSKTAKETLKLYRKLYRQ